MWQGKEGLSNVHITKYKSLICKMVHKGGGGKKSKNLSTWFMDDPKPRMKRQRQKRGRTVYDLVLRELNNMSYLWPKS